MYIIFFNLYFVYINHILNLLLQVKFNIIKNQINNNYNIYMDYNKDNIRKCIIYGGAFLMGVLVLGSWLKYPKPKRKSLISSDNLKDA